MNTLRPLIEESERLIEEAIKHFDLKVKPGQLLMTIQSTGRRSAYGWFACDRWNNGDKSAIHEINLTAEFLKDNDPAKTLLHELAHAENHKREIKDVAGRRHNLKFKKMAETLGLIVVEKAAPTIGYSGCECGPVAKQFLKKIAFKQKLFAMNRLELSGEGKSSGTRMIKVACPDCEYTVRTTQKWIDVGLPVCCCGGEMEVEA